MKPGPIHTLPTMHPRAGRNAQSGSDWNMAGSFRPCPDRWPNTWELRVLLAATDENMPAQEPTLPAIGSVQQFPTSRVRLALARHTSPPEKSIPPRGHQQPVDDEGELQPHRRQNDVERDRDHPLRGRTVQLTLTAHSTRVG